MTIYLVTSFSVSSVSRLRTLEAAALRLAEGDLRESGLQVQGRDEIARCMQAVTDTARTLRELIDGVVASADAVHASAAQLVAAGDQSAAAAENANGGRRRPGRRRLQAGPGRGHRVRGGGPAAGERAADQAGRGRRPWKWTGPRRWPGK